MNRGLLAGVLVGAAAVVGLLLWSRPASAPVEAVAPTTGGPTTTAPVVVAPAPAAKAAPAPSGAAVAPTATAPSGGVVGPPSAPASATNSAVLPPAGAPLTKQEKIEKLAPALPDLEQKVARLRKEADEEERQGHADVAKEKRVAADRNERRLGEIRAALAEGKLPPGYVNSSSTDKSKE